MFRTVPVILGADHTDPQPGMVRPESILYWGFISNIESIHYMTY